MQRVLKQYEIRRRRAVLAAAVATVLSVLVGLLVFWQLRTPGVAMTDEAVCGQEEHVHTDECYELQLVCGQEETETGHVHSDGCYETVKTLLCTEEEHVHDDGCYVYETYLDCSADEHTHSEGCYDPESGELVCGLEEHTHTDACYTTVGVLVCDKNTHTHSDECYETETTLVCTMEEGATHVHDDSCWQSVCVCGKEEHVHDVNCFCDTGADLESASVWEATIPADLPDNWGEAVAAVAKSQLGYAESSANFLMDGSEEKGYTRYGAWYGLPYGDWCCMFASFCLHYAGIDEADVPYAAATGAWIDALSEKGLYISASDYEPQIGDIVFFDQNHDGETAQHVGVVESVDYDESGALTVVRTIEGNTSDSVARREYDPDSGDILGYGSVAAAYDSYLASLVTFEDEAVPLANVVLYDNTAAAQTENFEITVYYNDDANLPEDAVLSAFEYDTDSDQFRKRSEEVDYELAWLMDIGFYDADGVKLEPETDVKVVIQSLSGESVGGMITHFAEDGVIETLAGEEDESSVTYTTSSFSDFAVKKASASDASSHIMGKINTQSISSINSKTVNANRAVYVTGGGTSTYAEATSGTTVNLDNANVTDTLTAGEEYVIYCESSGTYYILGLDANGKIATSIKGTYDSSNGTITPESGYYIAWTYTSGGYLKMSVDGTDYYLYLSGSTSKSLAVSTDSSKANAIKYNNGSGPSSKTGWYMSSYTSSYYLVCSNKTITVNERASSGFVSIGHVADTTTYAVVYDLNLPGVVDSEPTVEESTVENGKVKLPDLTTTDIEVGDTTYTFKGWATDSSATSAAYVKGATATLKNCNPTDNEDGGKTVTFYAVWVDKSQVTYTYSGTWTHIDVKTAAAIAKVDSTSTVKSVSTVNGNTSVTGVSYSTDGGEYWDVQELNSTVTNGEWTNKKRISLSCANVDNIQIKFTVEIETGTTTTTYDVILTSKDVYPEGTYYGGANVDNVVEKLGLTDYFELDGTKYYNISGYPIFLISSLVCDGWNMKENGNENGSSLTENNGEYTLVVDKLGLDLVLNVSTIINNATNVISGTKKLSGGRIESFPDAFTFVRYGATVKDGVWTQVENLQLGSGGIVSKQTTTNNVDGTASMFVFGFTQDTYIDSGTYYYIVTEEAGSDSHIKYDDSVYGVSVYITVITSTSGSTSTKEYIVSDIQYYKLTSTKDGNGYTAGESTTENIIVFTNTYTSDVIVTKKWEDSNSSHDNITLTLKDGADSEDNVCILSVNENSASIQGADDTTGEYTYYFTDENGDEQSYVVTVTVKDWKVTVENLPEATSEDGYIFVETEVKGYDTTYANSKGDSCTGGAPDGGTITNTPTQQYVKIVKVAGDNNDMHLDGAVFGVYKGEMSAGDNYLYTWPTTSSNSTTDEEATAVSEDEETESTSTGIIYDDDLDVGTYYLYETKAPDGYEKLTDPIIITVEPTGVTAQYKGGGTVTVSPITDENENVTGYEVVIPNNTGAKLPNTGGAGVLGFLLAGAGLMLVGGTGLVVTRRRGRRGNG